MCGIVAGLGSEAEHLYGDVVVPDVVWDYSAGKFTAPGKGAIIFGNVSFQPRPQSIALDAGDSGAGHGVIQTFHDD